MHDFETIKRAMTGRTTEELASIWRENDRERYTDEELEAARLALKERHAPLPPQQRTRVLFHGSTARHDVLTPMAAQDYGDPRGCREGVFATPIRDHAITFALGIVPDEQGRHFVMMRRTPFPIKRVYVYGTPNVGGKGYLYTLDPSSFEEVSLYQWVSEAPVKPRSIEEISVDEHLGLTDTATDDDRRWLRSRFPDLDELVREHFTDGVDGTSLR